VEVCSEPDRPAHTTIYRWLRARPAFAQAYAEARELQPDLLFDLAWSIARGAREGDVAAARLMIRTIKRRCARLAPKPYGTVGAARLARAEEEEALAEDEDEEEPEAEVDDPLTATRPMRVSIRRARPRRPGQGSRGVQGERRDVPVGSQAPQAARRITRVRGVTTEAPDIQRAN